MIKIIKLFFLFTSFLFFSCADKSRELMLDQREHELAEKEKQFALKEQDYETLIKMRDSLSSIKKTDTAITRWPAEINGLWSGKLLCIASQCGEYVIGDQKTNETWNFTTDSSTMLVAVLTNNTLVRVFNARYDSSGINLHFKTDSTAKKPVRMDVLLDEISGNRIKGTQTVIIDSSCIAKFSVDLSRIRNK
jgi:hypothetical protein